MSRIDGSSEPVRWISENVVSTIRRISASNPARRPATVRSTARPASCSVIDAFTILRSPPSRPTQCSPNLRSAIWRHKEQRARIAGASSRRESTVIEPLVIGDVFRAGARAAPHRTAAALGDRLLTFAEIDGSANRLARALLRLGIGHGARVACGPTPAWRASRSSPPCPSWAPSSARSTGYGGTTRLRPCSIASGPRFSSSIGPAPMPARRWRQRLALDVMALDALCRGRHRGARR